MELEEKIEDLTALVRMEAALNDLIALVTTDGYIPKVDVVYEPDGTPRVHVYMLEKVRTDDPRI